MLKPKMQANLEWAKEHLGWVRSRPFRRIASTFIVCSFMVAIIVTIHLTNTGSLTQVLGNIMPHYKSCSSINETGSSEIWEKSKKKFLGLRDDKFTIAMQTYQRPKELADTLDALLSERIPSLHEVVVVWNDLENETPKNYKSKYGVPVRYRMSKENSLNQKLWPDPAYETQSILLSDDDVFYHPSDLEFVFQTWRKFGRNRLTGALARCSDLDSYGKFKYTFCANKPEHDSYTMVLTNLAFTDISFMDYYSANETTMNRIRDYVDEGFNCEDIAFNYVHSLLTGEGPLLVNGRQKYVNYVPKQGISKKKGHLEARSQCLNDFAKMFECMPLVEENAYIQKGVLVM